MGTTIMTRTFLDDDDLKYEALYGDEPMQRKGRKDKKRQVQADRKLKKQQKDAYDDAQ